MRYRSRQYAFENPIVAGVIAVCVLAVALAWRFGDADDAAARAQDGPALAASTAILVLMFFMTVTQTVTGTHVRARVLGVFRRDVALADISSVEAREYRPLRQFGGWGMRWGANGSRAYTTTGRRAVVLTLTDGRELYLGARDPDGLADAIERARQLIGPN